MEGKAQQELYDPFLQKTVRINNDICDKLRGRYATGPTMANGEPEFGWREFPTPPIQHEAADLIESMLAALKSLSARINSSRVF